LVRPEYEGESVDELNDKNPYKRAISVTQSIELADTIIWYAYRFSKYFIKNLDYCEDILHEILFEISDIPFWDLTKEDVSRISRNTVARFVAKTVMTLSGYTNFRSWLNRKMFLRYKNENTSEEVLTELEVAVKEIEDIWNKGAETKQPILIIQDKYPLVCKYAESGLSMVNFCRLHKITKYRLCQQIDQARDEYISLLYIDSYIHQ